MLHYERKLPALTVFEIFSSTKEQTDAFQHLKELLTAPPILGFADYDLSFEFAYR